MGRRGSGGLADEMLLTAVGDIPGKVDGDESAGLSVTGGVKEGASEAATRTGGTGGITVGD